MNSLGKLVLALLCIVPLLLSSSDFCLAQGIEGTYKYVNQGYAGKLKATAKGANTFHIALTTAKVDTGHGCSFKGICTVKNNKIHCSDDDDGIKISAEFAIVKEGLELVEYEPHMFLCGMQGQMHGLYKK